MRVIDRKVGLRPGDDLIFAGHFARIVIGEISHRRNQGSVIGDDRLKQALDVPDGFAMLAGGEKPGGVLREFFVDEVGTGDAIDIAQGQRHIRVNAVG